jgi:transcriptional regulator with XRE-family HTH domain
MELGTNLRYLRKSRGLTIKKVAEGIGINHHSLGNYESGRRNPTPDTIKKLAIFYGVSTDMILGHVLGTKKGEDIADKIAIYRKKIIPVLVQGTYGEIPEINEDNAANICFSDKKSPLICGVLIKHRKTSPLLKYGDLVFISKEISVYSKRTVYLMRLEVKLYLKHIIKFGWQGKEEGIMLYSAEKDECEKFQRISYEEFAKKNIFGHVVKIAREVQGI